MNFVTAVNRLLRTNQIIKGDDDDIADFTDTQHAADIELAQIAIQDELASLVAERLIPYEKTSATISLVTSTRVYALASDFVRFYGSKPSFYDSTDNVRIYEHKGGEDKIRDEDYQYKTTEGNPFEWYWDDTTSKQVAFYQVPSSGYNGRSLSYDYEKSVLVTLYTDTIPLHTEEEAQALVSCAARRFFVMDKTLQIPDLNEEPMYKDAKARLLEFLRNTNSSKSYGRKYI